MQFFNLWESGGFLILKFLRFFLFVNKIFKFIAHFFIVIGGLFFYLIVIHICFNWKFSKKNLIFIRSYSLKIFVRRCGKWLFKFKFWRGCKLYGVIFISKLRLMYFIFDFYKFCLLFSHIIFKILIIKSI